MFGKTLQNPEKPAVIICKVMHGEFFAAFESIFVAQRTR
jgi:hypothetical protein